MKFKHQKVNKDYLDEDSNNLEDDTEIEEYNSNIIDSPNNNVENNSRPSIEITPQPPAPMHNSDIPNIEITPQPPSPMHNSDIPNIEITPPSNSLLGFNLDDSSNSLSAEEVGGEAIMEKNTEENNESQKSQKCSFFVKLRIISVNKHYQGYKAPS